MKSRNSISFFKGILVFFLITLGTECYAQYSQGMGGMGNNGMGRQRSAIPRTQHAPDKPEPQTAEQIVDQQMPAITEALLLNDFETAVVSSLLKNYVQERIEAQILKLPPEKMSEVFKDIADRQDEELKLSLPSEKYEAFLEMQKEGLSKTLKKNKKKKKKQKKNKE